MSAEATFWAWRQQGISSTAKLVLLCLADCHNPDTGRCDPSAKYIAEKSELNIKTIPVALRRLEEMGLIAVLHRPGTSPSYTLNLTQNWGTPKTGVPENGSTQKRIEGTPKTGDGGTPKTGDETKRETKKNLKDIFPPDSGQGQTNVKKRKCQIPDDFVLTEHLRGLAIAHWTKRNRPDLDPDYIFAEFLASHRSKGTVMLDWNAAWTTWYMNAPKFTPAPRGQTNASNHQPDKPRSAVDRVKAGIEQRSREREEALARQRQVGDDARPAVGADDRDIRAPLDERLRGLSGGRVGDCIDGDYTRDDPPWAGSHGY